MRNESKKNRIGKKNRRGKNNRTDKKRSKSKIGGNTDIDRVTVYSYAAFISTMMRHFPSLEFIREKKAMIANLLLSISDLNYYNKRYYTQAQAETMDALKENLNILNIFSDIYNNENSEELFGLIDDNLFVLYKKNNYIIEKYIKMMARRDMIDILNLETLVKGEKMRDDFVRRSMIPRVKALSDN